MAEFEFSVIFVIVVTVIVYFLNVICMTGFKHKETTIDLNYLIVYNVSKLLTESSWMNVGETFILFNQQMKGNKREMIQLGVPIFGKIKEEAKSKDKISIKIFKITNVI